MREKQARLAVQRERLIAQAAAQRTAFAENIEPLRVPLARVDQGLEALRYLKRHPMLLLGGVALVSALSWNRSGKWLQRGWVLWQIVRKIGGSKQ